MASACYNILKRGILNTPKLPTLGVIDEDEDDYFEEITDIMADDEEKNDEEASPFWRIIYLNL